MRTAVRLLAALLLALCWTVGTGPQAGAKQATGTIVDFGFTVPTDPLRAGDSVSWTNTGARPHTVTDRGGMFDTGAILPGAQGEITLTAPGTYFFFCEINPSRMNGTLEVAPGPEAPTEVRVQAVDEARDGAAKAFDPVDVEVAAGARVILANVGGVAHSLTADDGSFDTGVIQPGAEGGRFHGSNGSVVVDEPGEYGFFCVIHPAAMRGTLTVTDERVRAEDRAPPEAEPPPSSAAVAAIDFAFDRASTEVAPGGTVTWSNTGAKPHTATFDDVVLDTGRIEPGADATLQAPEEPGTYSYACTIHPTQMRGVLVVAPTEGVAGAGVAGGSAAAGDDEGDDAAAPPPVDEETDGTVLAYVIAVPVVGVGLLGLVLGLRKRAV